jgi:SAM-dependent methyltransferase
MSTNPKQVVQDGYDRVSYIYREDEAGPLGSRYLDWINAMCIPPQSRILELGCGCGIPVARELAPHHRYLGVDLSPVQIERARRLVPDGDFACVDMTALSFSSGSFDAIIALYSLIHVPVEEQRGLLLRITDWLKPGAQFLAIVGSEAWTGTESDWLGVKGATMYWSHAEAATYRRWLHDYGYTVLRDEFVAEGVGGHQLMQVKRAE